MSDHDSSVRAMPGGVTAKFSDSGSAVSGLNVTLTGYRLAPGDWAEPMVDTIIGVSERGTTVEAKLGDLIPESKFRGTNKPGMGGQ